MVKTKDIPQSRTQKNAGDLLLGSLSNSNRDGYENVTFKKSEFALLKICRAYSIAFNSSKVGKFFSELNPEGLYQSSVKESCCRLSPSSIKREIVVVVRTTAKKCTKKRDARA